MRVNHGFIAARRRLYGKHVCGLSRVTAFSPSRRRARDGPYFSSPKCRTETTFQHRYNITPAYSLSANLRSDATPIPPLPTFSTTEYVIATETERISIEISSRDEGTFPSLFSFLFSFLKRQRERERHCSYSRRLWPLADAAIN